MAERIERFKGFTKEMHGTKWGMGEEECNITFERCDPVILAVCPNCGREIVAHWVCYENKYTMSGRINNERCEKVEKYIESKYSYYTMRGKVVSEIMEYRKKKNFCCDWCSAELVEKPGYYYENEYVQDILFHAYLSNIDKECRQYYNVHYSGQNIKEPFGMKEEVIKKLLDDKRYTNQYTDLPDDDERYKKVEEAKRRGEIINIIWQKMSIDSIFTFLHDYREETRLPELAVEVDQWISSKAEELRETEAVQMAAIDEANTDFLKQYLYHLIQIETDICSLSKRMPGLYFVQEENARTKEQLIDLRDDIRQIKEKHTKLEKEENIIGKGESDELWKSNYERILNEKKAGDYPEKPQEPDYPQLEKAGLFDIFHKKKIEEENAAKLREYNVKHDAWKKEETRYELAVAKIEQNVTEEAKREAEQQISDAENGKKKLQEEIASLNEELEEKRKAQRQEIQNTWDVEVQEAENTLKKCIEAKLTYESCNVVFPKYRNLIAYASFYEYLESGRCDSLSGVNGAYNLYEAELKQNTVIAQLSKVLESMEDIKTNQYVAYSQLHEMNKNLHELNTSMHKAVESLGQIQGAAKKIVENSELTAYNTAATAYYTKINTQLTNALGYMVAFKS